MAVSSEVPVHHDECYYKDTEQEGQDESKKKAGVFIMCALELCKKDKVIGRI